MTRDRACRGVSRHWTRPDGPADTPPVRRRVQNKTVPGRGPDLSCPVTRVYRKVCVYACVRCARGVRERSERSICCPRSRAWSTAQRQVRCPVAGAAREVREREERALGTVGVRLRERCTPSLATAYTTQGPGSKGARGAPISSPAALPGLNSKHGTWMLPMSAHGILRRPRTHIRLTYIAPMQLR